MDAQTLVLGAVIAFLAAACQSVTGFGFALVMMPLLAIVWEVKLAVATSVILGVLLNVVMLSQLRGHVVGRRLPGIYAGYAIGFVPGLIFLDRVNGDVLQITVGVVVILATILLYFQPAIEPGNESPVGGVVAGAFSGASSSATSIGGPPVVLYLMGREEMDRFRATLMAFFLPSSIVTLTAFVVVGRITGDVLQESAVAAPFIVAGVFAGAWVRAFIDAAMFRRLVVATLIVTSMAIILFTLL